MNSSNIIDKNVRLVGRKSSAPWVIALLAIALALAIVWGYQQGYFDSILNQVTPLNSATENTTR